jgi:hypothetical protein
VSLGSTNSANTKRISTSINDVHELAASLGLTPTSTTNNEIMTMTYTQHRTTRSARSPSRTDRHRWPEPNSAGKAPGKFGQVPRKKTSRPTQQPTVFYLAVTALSSTNSTLAGVAQSVERVALINSKEINLKVVGSSPTFGYSYYRSSVEQLFFCSFGGGFVWEVWWAVVAFLVRVWCVGRLILHQTRGIHSSAIRPISLTIRADPQRPA